MDTVESRCGPWTKGKLRGQKPPLKPKEIWAPPASGCAA